MSQRSFTRKCGSCQAKVTVVYPQAELVYGWETRDAVWPNVESFICPLCGRKLIDGQYPLAYYAALLLKEVRSAESEKKQPTNSSRL